MDRRHFLQLASTACLLPKVAIADEARIRIGQIGTGHAHAGGKLETLRKLTEYEVVGVVELDPERRALAAKNPIYAGVPWMTEEQLLNTPNLQAVAVETQVRDLVPTALRCLAAGKHLHLDKPGGESLPAFAHLLQEAERQKLIIQMGYMLRYNPAMVRCFELVRTGSLGEIFSIEAVMSKALAPAERRGLLDYRGGSIFELGCHLIDAAVYLLGRPFKVTGFHRSSSALNDGWSDNGLAVLEYPKATVTIRSSMNEIDGGNRRQFVVNGSAGTFEIRPLEPARARLALAQAQPPYKQGSQELSFPKPTGRYDNDLIDFAQVLRGQKPFAFSKAHDLAVQETLLLASGLPID